MTVSIHDTAIVDPNAQLGDDVFIGPFCIVGPEVKLGDRTQLVSHVTLAGRTHIGADCALYPQVSMGHPPQDFKHKGEKPIGIEIGDRCVFREMSNVHPGTDVGRPITRIGDDCYLMVGSHIAHECQVGTKVTLSNYAQVGGNVTIGDNVTLGGLSAIHQHTRIGQHAFIAGMALVTNDVIPYGLAMGNAAHLNGLNVIGLKRRGFSRESIHRLRAAYRQLFAPEGTMAERIEDAEKLYAEDELVTDVIAFIKGREHRDICLPNLRR